MKFIRKYIDKIKPNFEPGGKLAKFHSTFDAFETFLFVPNTTTQKGAHIRDAIDLKRTMSIVVLALVPALLFGMYNVGYQHSAALGVAQGFFADFWFGFLEVLPLIIVSYVVGLGIEFIFAQIRHHEVNEGFLVSGILIPMVMPVDCPLWMVAVATAFAVIIGKEVFGGTGMNILNPALLARAFVFFAYPTKISGNTIWVSGLTDGSAVAVDGFSGATPLALAPDAMTNGGVVDWASQPVCDWFMGFMPGSIGETSTIAILLGAALLLFTGVASFKVMFSVFAGGLLTGLMFNAIGANTYMDMPAYYHLVIGGFAFGAVFMATDPVTGSQTSKGKWIYGFLVGVLAVLIRVVNPGYPEGMMLAILFMNVMAPLIDHYVVESNIKRRQKRAVALSK
ncbi:MAG: NADH:ubiquinone reductase (Na(+)-transporting) subunit B [Rikenellaceae bacterium]